MIRFDILTLFPNMFKGLIEDSIIKRAIEKKLIEVNLIDFREFSTNKHHTVDDYSYGGGAGMLISVEPVHLAMKTIPNLDHAKKLLMSPSGKTFNQAKAIELSKEEHIVMVCGHYEGIDARILNFIDEEVSIGDYVLMGGEVPAMTILEAVSRLVPGVISEDSPVNESFSDSLLEHPQYTRPAIYEGFGVPDVLLSGHHANIKKWQREKALEKTLKVRPDLLKKANLDLNDYKYLWELKNEKN
ncbi:MAG: tRNA (guanosine(37)-N1)-methyltransferase TrmD [Bacilli bacterium]|nr:tRNA (guanosine(37)-N1)-methyltransferase TrmD [Bacilli bacterium]